MRKPPQRKTSKPTCFLVQFSSWTLAIGVPVQRAQSAQFTQCTDSAKHLAPGNGKEYLFIAFGQAGYGAVFILGQDFAFHLLVNEKLVSAITHFHWAVLRQYN